MRKRSTFRAQHVIGHTNIEVSLKLLALITDGVKITYTLGTEGLLDWGGLLVLEKENRQLSTEVKPLTALLERTE